MAAGCLRHRPYFWRCQPLVASLKPPGTAACHRWPPLSTVCAPASRPAHALKPPSSPYSAASLVLGYLQPHQFYTQSPVPFVLCLACSETSTPADPQNAPTLLTAIFCARCSFFFCLSGFIFNHILPDPYSGDFFSCSFSLVLYIKPYFHRLDRCNGLCCCPALIGIIQLS